MDWSAYEIDLPGDAPKIGALDPAWFNPMAGAGAQVQGWGDYPIPGENERIASWALDGSKAFPNSGWGQLGGRGTSGANTWDWDFRPYESDRQRMEQLGYRYVPGGVKRVGGEFTNRPDQWVDANNNPVPPEIVNRHMANNWGADAPEGQINFVRVKSGDKEGTVVPFAMKDGRWVPIQQGVQTGHWDTNGGFADYAGLAAVLGGAALGALFAPAAGATAGAEAAATGALPAWAPSLANTTFSVAPVGAAEAAMLGASGLTAAEIAALGQGAIAAGGALAPAAGGAWNGQVPSLAPSQAGANFRVAPVGPAETTMLQGAGLTPAEIATLGEGAAQAGGALAPPAGSGFSGIADAIKGAYGAVPNPVKDLIGKVVNGGAGVVDDIIGGVTGGSGMDMARLAWLIKEYNDAQKAAGRAEDQFGAAAQFNKEQIDRVTGLAEALQGRVLSGLDENKAPQLVNRAEGMDERINSLASTIRDNKFAGIDRAAAIAASKGFSDSLGRGLGVSTTAAQTYDDVTRRFADVYRQAENEARGEATTQVGNVVDRLTAGDRLGLDAYGTRNQQIAALLTALTGTNNSALNAASGMNTAAQQFASDAAKGAGIARSNIFAQLFSPTSSPSAGGSGSGGGSGPVQDVINTGWDWIKDWVGISSQQGSSNPPAMSMPGVADSPKAQTFADSISRPVWSQAKAAKQPKSFYEAMYSSDN